MNDCVLDNIFLNSTYVKNDYDAGSKKDLRRLICHRNLPII